MKTYNEIIDYNYVNSFDINILKKALVLPIKSDGIYFRCFVCDESNIELLNLDSLIKNIYMKKEDILFFLSDIKNRLKLFCLSKKINKDENISKDYIEKFFKILITKAIVLRSSDIHLETYEKSLVIRFRIDGVLKIFYIFEKEFINSISSYIKMVSKLDLTQTRLPMDGRFNINIDNKKFDFRVSTMPTVFGESLVLRVLDNQNIKKELIELGFTKDIYEQIQNITKLTQGLVLVTGPTGSGKSTTLYSLIDKLNKEDKKIITVEDPVEYKIEQIQQIEVNEDLNLDFNTVLKNILRQDPDIILIGEIRDEKSLSIALQAALTGHLVFASIHANNSLETLSRLVNLKANRYLFATTLKYIISQRLVLNICKVCENKGCKECNYSGFKGRSCIAEVLKLDEKLISMILNSVPQVNIKDYLDEIGFKTLLDNGEKKVKDKITTLSQVYKVINI